MKPLLIFTLLIGALNAWAQIPPPLEASQAQVNAGILTGYYVSPATLAARLAGISGPTNGITSATASNIISGTFGGTIYSNGKFGLSKASPVYAVDALLGGYQQLRMISTNDDSLVTLGSQITGSTNWTFGATSRTSGQPTNAFILETSDNAAGNTAIRLLVQGITGNMGIGTSTPRTRLDVSGTVTATGFAGSGAALTAIDGTQISSGTINSNSLDANTLAALQAGGGGGATLNQVTNVFYGLITNAVTGQVQASTNPVVWETITVTNAAGQRTLISATNITGVGNGLTGIPVSGLTTNGMSFFATNVISGRMLLLGSLNGTNLFIPLVYTNGL